jgi:hypothetical protein
MLARYSNYNWGEGLHGYPPDRAIANVAAFSGERAAVTVEDMLISSNRALSELTSRAVLCVGTY